MDRSRKKVAIFGAKANCLFLLRGLHFAGFEVHLITKDREVGGFSSCGIKHIITNNHPVSEIAKEIYRKHGRMDAFATDEENLRYVLYEHKEIMEYFDFFMADYAAMKEILFKDTGYKLCRQLGIPVPKTYDMSYPWDLNLPLPIFAKRNTNNDFAIEIGIPKTFRIRTRADLEKYLDAYYDYGSERQSFILQELLDDNWFCVSMGGFFREGIEKFSIVVEQKRRYPEGFSCYVVEAEDSKWVEMVKKYTRLFAREIRYSGFMEIEFMTNGRDVMLLDINPRLWKWNSILYKKYPGFANGIWGNDDLRTCQRRVRWIDLRKFTLSIILGSKEKKAVNLLDWFLPIKIDILNWKDMGVIRYLWEKRKWM